MTTKREKGNDFQVWVRDLLESWGWTVRNFPAISGKKRGGGWFCLKMDVFGADLVARKNGRVLWIQTSLDGHVTRRQKEFEEHFSFLLEGEELQLWIDTGCRKINVKMFRPGDGPVTIGRIYRKKLTLKEGIDYEF